VLIKQTGGMSVVARKTNDRLSALVSPDLRDRYTLDRRLGGHDLLRTQERQTSLRRFTRSLLHIVRGVALAIGVIEADGVRET
jgi:hypothetical protein